MERSILTFILLYVLSLQLTVGKNLINLKDSIPKTYNATLYFRFDDSGIIPDYLSNRQNLNRIDSLTSRLCKTQSIDSVIVSSYSSPEGDPVYNALLALRRSEEIQFYIINRCNHLTKDFVKIRSLGENWVGLKELVLRDTALPGRSQVLMILDKTISSMDKEEQIKAVMNGAAWRYIERNMLRYLRGASCLMFYVDPVKIAAADATSIPMIQSPAEQPSVNHSPVTYVSETVIPVSELAYRLVRPVALKTNLLFDAVTALNFEVEVPVAKRFSIAGEWMFPWWLWEKKQNCLEVLSGNLEARYWFRPNFAKQDPSLGLHNPLTGWFVGVYGGGGKYDLEWKREGYQGEFFIATGVSGGYVLPLSRNISMEFSLGIGLMRTKYWHYHAEFCDKHDDWHLNRQFNGTHTWFGPTKAKVSFIWYPHFKMKKKGGIR